MSEALVFYSSPMSRGRIVHWMLEEVGVPYRFEVVNLETQDQKKPGFLAVNPMGKVPAIVHRGTVVTECGAMCAYLADAFPAARLAPPVDSPLRGTYYRWLFFGGTCVEAAVIDRMLSRPPASRPGALGYGSYDDTVATLEKALTPGPYILGPQFSAADVYVGSQIGFGTMMKALDPRPVFKDYLDRLQERPAYKRFMEKSDQIAGEMKKAG
jgi:glutathione S-transferase